MGTRGTILWVNKYNNGEEKPFNEFFDYNYEIVYSWTLDLPMDGIWADKMITIRVFNWESDKPIFVGSPRELLNYMREEEKKT